MYVSRYSCRACNVEVSGDFGSANAPSLFELDASDTNFIKLFMKHEGNLHKTQTELGLGYNAVKARIQSINIKLGNFAAIIADEVVTTLNVSNSGLPSDHLKALLNKHGGRAEVAMLRGEALQIWMTSDGIANSGLPGLVCEWHIFDAIVTKAQELGGQMYRGDAQSQQGKRIGDATFHLDTIDAYISVNFYGHALGSTTLRRSTYYAAILAWANIASNHRSSGAGGYIKLLPPWDTVKEH